jgi:PAS domain S-box-containing protein
MKKKLTYEELAKSIKELERERQFEHDRLMNILRDLPYGVYIVDRQCNIQYINPAIEGEFGSVKGRKCYAYLYDRTEICPWCKIEEVFAGKSVHWNFHSLKTDRHYDLFEMPFGNLDGSISKFLIFHDITELKRTQEAQKKTIHELGERVKELNCLFDLSALVEKKGASLEDFYRGTVELLCRSWQYPEITCARIGVGGKEFRSENFKQTIWKQTSDIIVQGKPGGAIEICYIEETPECDEGPFLKEERALLDAVAERLGKITERKQAEKAILKSEQRFRDLINSSPTGITIIQGDKVVYRNSAQKRLAGAFEDPSLSVTFENIHPDDAQMVERNYQKLTLGMKKHIDMEFRFYPAGKSADRHKMKWVYCMASVIDYQGKDAILINLMDVTIAKELDHILRIQDKMTSLGRVAAGIAHEIRNPLSGINIYLKTLDKISSNYDNHEKITQILSQLQSASNKIESVIKRVMDFSRPGEPKFVLTDINQPIMEAVNLSSVTLRKSGIRFSLDISPDLPKCKADPRMIEQVILNLINNASEAMQTMHKGKKINISSFLENDAICIKVCDSGRGIPKDIRNNVIEPFYTTKSSGSGIGLSICHRIITDHGGLLHISDAELGGAEFIISIPIDSKTGKK